MSPRYSNCTSSIRGYDYTICITQSQIQLFNQHIEPQKSAPNILPDNHDENVCQPLCIGSWAEHASWSPKHTSSESCDIPLSPQIRTARHTSSVIKSLKTQSDKITSKGKLNPLQESRGGRNIIRSNYNNKARDTSRSCQIKNTRERDREIKLLEIWPRGNNKMVIIVFPCSW